MALSASSDPASVLVHESRPDRAVKRANFVEKITAVVAGQIRIEHDIADLAVGLQILRDNVDVALQKYFVQPPEHAGHVAVNVAEAGAERMCLQLDLREIHRAHRGAAAEIIEHLAGHLPADTILRLLGRTTDVRGQDHVLETLQGALK